MVNVSKNLNPKTLRRIEKEFITLLTKQETNADMSHILNELLTPDEKIMLMKRLAAVAMLSQGFSTYQIHKTLKMSTNTPQRLDKKLRNGEFNNLSKKYGFKATKKCERLPSGTYSDDEVLEFIGKILRGGLPPYTGYRRK